jgi:hypothetical protein
MLEGEIICFLLLVDFHTILNSGKLVLMNCLFNCCWWHLDFNHHCCLNKGSCIVRYAYLTK